MEREQHLQTGQRGLSPLRAAHRRSFARLIVALLPLILAACTNGGGGGPGY
jgi:hypothetical protein